MKPQFEIYDRFKNRFLENYAFLTHDQKLGMAAQIEYYWSLITPWSG